MQSCSFQSVDEEEEVDQADQAVYDVLVACSGWKYGLAWSKGMYGWGSDQSGSRKGALFVVSVHFWMSIPVFVAISGWIISEKFLNV